jgi:hypothetical protein
MDTELLALVDLKEGIEKGVKLKKICTTEAPIALKSWSKRRFGWTVNLSRYEDISHQETKFGFLTD